MNKAMKYFRLAACTFIFSHFRTWQACAWISITIFKAFVWMRLVSEATTFDLNKIEYETGKKHFKKWKESEFK